MFSTSNLLSRGLLVAGAMALPLVSGAAFAQTATTPTPAATSASTPSAQTTNSRTTSTSTAASTDKPMGALKATPAEKKAAHDKKMANKAVQKTAGTKASNAMKKQAVDTKTAPAAQPAKPASGTPVTQ